MTEPRVHYAKTADGVRIAYATEGKGAPVLMIPFAFISHVTEVFTLPGSWLSDAVRRFQVTWYDCRGSGLSQRDIDNDISIELLLRDVEAVVQHAGLERLAVVAIGDGTPIAIRYAAENADRVTHLLLADPWSEASDWNTQAAGAAQVALSGQNWVLYTETLARILANVGDSVIAGKWAELMRASAEPEMYYRAMQSMEDWNVTADLPRITAATLILRNKKHPFAAADTSQRIASDIPNASLQIIDDMSYSRIGEALAELLGEKTAVTIPTRSEASTLRTVLFTDLVGHTEMMSRLGDKSGRDVLREHERITREVLKAYDGTEIKTDGDSFMISFGSVTRALECAIALQRAFAGREGEPLSIRMGLNAGEPIEEDGDLFGATVILASRIAAKADGGEILVSDNVRSLSAGKGFLFADLGEFVAKGFEEPVRVYEVRWQR